MEKQYDNTDRGALFKNDRKEKDTHPDLGGTLNVGGKEYFISSYSKKYALNSLFAIDDTKDADFSNKHNNNSPVTKTVATTKNELL